ncbi:LacI family transcriptional regulator [Mycobacterium sp. KBS0706]|uniref:LacI family DNA-binding transcriptional regulator n=1 Tax=Mycobacterium sp. KBS0706 TaxID=2578109 RepID=UPI00110FCAA1|nr:LacI family DNA-binding transcriptional regulator [Mycobacterium sp. KBS0706]TSD90302.1 LacI family transcriptional regulator [Mycobacterium sp. KBS0706]
MATIRDVAREAGVSPATVSRHLNGNIELPAETAGRIDAASKRLGYRPNLLAKRLSLGSSETIGLVTPEIANPFFAALAAAAEDEARRAGFSILLSSTGGDLEMEAASIDRLAARHVDGLLVLTNRVDDGRLRDLIDGRTDVVLLDEDVPGANVTRIFVENEAGAYDATRHLIAAGHRRIAHIGGPEQLLSAQERFAGFARAMAEAGLAVADGMVRFGAYERDFGRDATRAILANGRPTAVFTGSDYIAIGVLQELAANGLSVPGDLSLASFDDMPFADLLSPPITTVRQPIEALGRLGIRTLLARIRGEDPPPIQRLPTELVIRKSVGPPSGKAKKKTG